MWWSLWRKTTMARLLEEKHGFIRYRQGDHYDEYVSVASEKEQPAITLKIIEKHFGL